MTERSPYSDLPCLVLLCVFSKVCFQISAPDHPSRFEPQASWPCRQTLPLSYGSLPKTVPKNLDPLILFINICIERVIIVPDVPAILTPDHKAGSILKPKFCKSSLKGGHSVRVAGAAGAP